MNESSERIILTDIEGTIADIAFVRKVLFPFARRALPAFIRAHASEPAVRAELEATAEVAGLRADDLEALTETLCAWIDEDRKAPSLKALQGMIWKAGYARGDFVAHLYPDAHRWLGARYDEGLALYVYSSGSIAAQDLYFRYNEFGDLRDWFQGFFDTTVGPKKDPDSYRAIAAELGVDPARIVFFSDSVEELDAAHEAGLITAEIRREGASPSGRHPAFENFDSIELEQL
ncbi:acireductone synthase [Wenzhouxiangella marina]|uniref:Enolase-phosphatase E1 n=1 Tax=Wenzhouxiangella marina TaxID=1579979 RepID=A0A0K0XS62_9GAMM|nr:acireductone synthase [Wenzhouxiangella marina]AKS40495.1 haloacid dehalogenase [Wenzhouxiangella marina]MBB6088183.1 enolase-phosphatase E1 [Wenzhouxiangella marina]